MTDTEAGFCGCDEVCSLPSDELRDRTAMIRRDLLPQVTRREELDDGMAFEFRYSPAMRQTLEELVAFERECCSGLTWELRRPAEEILRLSVEGLPADSDFFRSIGGSATPPGGPFARALQAAGFGAGAGLLLCCVLPIGVAAVATPAIALAVLQLDDPRVVTVVSVTLAATAWWWSGRR